VPYLSTMLGKRIRDTSGVLMGRLGDVVAEPTAKFPVVKGIEVSSGRGRGGRHFYVPWSGIREWRDECLVVAPDTAPDARPDEGDVFLVRDLLDKQMVDMDGYKIVRVSDIRLAWSGRQMRVIGADVGLLAILRRLGLSWIAERLRDIRVASVKERIIPWNLVSPVSPQPHDVRLRVPYREFLEIHPSDIADIIEQLDVNQRAKVLALVDTPKAAAVLPQILPAIRSTVARDMDDARLSDLLEIMPPDEAADILGSFSREKAQALLSLMGIEEASVVAELLGYDPSTAGGRMTTEFIAVPDYLTTAQTIDLLREKGAEAETIYYIYVVDAEGHLSGVLSLRDLLRAPTDEVTGRIMSRDIITADVDDDQERVADKLSRYNLLALPVMDHDHVLKGIVTVDDAIDVIREESTEDFSQLSGVAFENEGTPVSDAFDPRRWAGILLTFIGGVVATALFGLFKKEFVTALALVYFVPLALRASHDVSVWSLAMSVSDIPEEGLAGAGYARFIGREYLFSFTAAVIISVLGLSLCVIWTDSRVPLVAGASGVFAAVALAGILGLVVPIIIKRVRLDPVLAPGRLVGVSVMAVSMLAFLTVSALMVRAMR
jgi:magnesium transporter